MIPPDPSFRSLRDELAKITPAQQPTFDEMASWNEALPDEEFFRRGACHVLAVELLAIFEAEKGPSKIHVIPAGSFGGHVVVQHDGSYYDVAFGPHSGEAMLSHWPDLSQEFVPMGEPQKLLCAGKKYQHLSSLGHCIDPAWLERAQQRARAFIARNRERFGLAPQKC